MSYLNNFKFLWLMITILSAVMLGCVHPTEPILSIHRAGRMSLMYSKTGVLNDTFEDAFDPSLLLMQNNKFDKVSSSSVRNDDIGVDDNSTSVLPAYYTRTDAIFCAFLSACIVGLTGIFPLMFFTSIDNEVSGKGKSDAKQLNRLLSFAVGGLLGDVFLHLLPEAWGHVASLKGASHDHASFLGSGIWVLVGLLSFCMLEKLFPDVAIGSETDVCVSANKKDEALKDKLNNNNPPKAPSQAQSSPNILNQCQTPIVQKKTVKTSGYLNLLANCIDNFTHGLAVGGSYLVSLRVGVLTTIAILLHEIPHEVGDFAILLRAGLDRWHAARLQLLTATGGLLGTSFALLAESAQSAGDRVAWILPFTSGGFIYVALCTVVPDILKETSPVESLIQVLSILLGIAVMYGVSFIG